ncbi:hypothetical protein FOI42_RS03260 [Escherichia coli]|nr:hypothetical protein [Escherichia coli]MED6699327.1 hypothetical protein [Escherichia coli O157]HCQ0858662.1 hypothetical protein [Escherichia coli]
MYKNVNHHLYASKYRDFCLQGGDEDFALRLSEFNMLFYLGTSVQEEMVQKFIKHLERKIHTQILVVKLQNEINEYNAESNNSTGS